MFLCLCSKIYSCAHCTSYMSVYYLERVLYKTGWEQKDVLLLLQAVLSQIRHMYLHMGAHQQSRSLHSFTALSAVSQTTRPEPGSHRLCAGIYYHSHHQPLAMWVDPWVSANKFLVTNALLSFRGWNERWLSNQVWVFYFGMNNIVFYCGCVNSCSHMLT